MTSLNETPDPENRDPGTAEAAATPAAGLEAQQQDAHTKGPLRSGVELVLTLVGAVLLALLVQAFLIKPYKIPSTSMVPTLKIGQRILVNRLDTSPAVGAVVVFHPPADADAGICADRNQGPGHAAPCDLVTAGVSSQTFVKRVVGLPGDHLLIKGGYVWRNGVKETGSYVNLSDCHLTAECSFKASITVPNGDFYMMGDNRGNSDDSRYWGPVPEQNIIGVAVATYWPPDRIGLF